LKFFIAVTSSARTDPFWTVFFYMPNGARYNQLLPPHSDSAADASRAILSSSACMVFLQLRSWLSESFGSFGHLMKSFYPPCRCRSTQKQVCVIFFLLFLEKRWPDLVSSSLADASGSSRSVMISTSAARVNFTLGVKTTARHVYVPPAAVHRSFLVCLPQIFGLFYF